MLALSEEYRSRWEHKSMGECLGPMWVNLLFRNLYAILPGGSFSDVGTFDAYEMVGNVWDWVADWHAEDYYSVSAVENPTGPKDGKMRILRGHCYGVYDAAIGTSIRR
ncbi:MAG: hypothetical protein CVU39_27775 [Chloroflexi bacterium HGW-Chloroflexi-10]|nr:MAG: hypothetical protein CVU39_27775 [Chloroflexi bacterium HGW-Chloroflexi-10]